MHIMLIANDTTFIYNLRKEILTAFVNEGHRVTVVGEIRNFKTELEALGCALIDIKTNRHGTNPLSDIWLFMRYYDIIKTEMPDVVFTNNIKPNVYVGIACRMKKVNYVPNITGLGTAVEYPGLMQRLTTFLYRVGMAGANTIFFQNEENLCFFEERKMIGEQTNVVLLPGSGVNLDKHKMMEYSDSEEINFLFVARILKEKGIDIYISAAKAIRNKYPNTRFHVCGMCDDDRYIDVIKNEEESGNIIYHGEVQDITPYFQRAHCIVHPSYYPEGMSNVLLEAASSGRPVITTNRSGCRETVDDGVSGYIVLQKDDSDLIKKIEKFMNLSIEDRKKMGLAGREKMEREFDRQQVVEIYLQEIRDAKII